MKPAPPLEEPAGFFRPQIEFSALHLFVGRQNHDKGERNHLQEE